MGFRPVFFQPAAGKYAGEICEGVQVHILDRVTFEPVGVGFEALAAVRRLYPSEFAWHVPAGGIHNFDRLAGTDQIRRALDAGATVAELQAAWTEACQAFDAIRRRYLAYS